MATSRSLSFSLLLLFSSSNALAADDGWQQRESRMGSPKHYFTEFCMKLGQGKTLHVEIDTPYRVDFNIHFHTETDTVFPVREPVEGEREFAVTADAGGDYCVMFTNPETRPEEFFITTRYRVR